METSEQKFKGNREKIAETRQRVKELDFSRISMLASSISVNDTALFKYLETVPIRFRLRVMRSLTGEASHVSAARLKCVECCGFEDTDNRIANCSSWRCPLWTFRPFHKGSEDDSTGMGDEI